MPPRFTTTVLLFSLVGTSAMALSGEEGARDVEPRSKRLLVMAPARFHPALREYVAHKRDQLPVEVCSLEAALRGTEGADDPEKLKRFLYERWKSHGVSHVLLVGDADVLPVRYMVLDRKIAAAYHYAFYPSDLYYADLAEKDGGFEDWNSKQEGFHAAYYGEVRGEKNKDDPINYDDVDYIPDVAVGRWPVSTPEAVRIVAGKTRVYELGLRAGRKPNSHRVALVCVKGWVDCRGRMDEWGRLLEPDWTVERRFYGGGRRSYDTPPPTTGEVLKLLNGGLGLLLHAGHGKDDRWQGSLALEDLGRLKNADRLGVILSAGCSTARFTTLPPYETYVDIHGKVHPGTNRGEVFEAPPPPPAPYQRGRFRRTGLGEQLVRRSPHGAVAYIGCNTGSQPCGLTLLAGFVHSVKHREEPLLGDCWNDAITYYVEKERLRKLVPTESWYPASIFFQGMKFMLFGDPTLPLE